MNDLFVHTRRLRVKLRNLAVSFDNNLVSNNSGDTWIEKLSLENELKSIIMLSEDFNAFKLCCKTIVVLYLRS